MAKMLIIPTMPVTVSTPPNRTPACLEFRRKELTKTPKDEALKLYAALEQEGPEHSFADDARLPLLFSLRAPKP